MKRGVRRFAILIWIAAALMVANEWARYIFSIDLTNIPGVELFLVMVLPRTIEGSALAAFATIIYLLAEIRDKLEDRH